MITVEELARVNIINENLHRLERLNNIFKGNVDFSIDHIEKVFTSDNFRILISEYIPIIQADLMSEYNKIISPSEPNSLSQS